MKNRQIILLLCVVALLASCGREPLPYPGDLTKIATNVGINDMLILRTTNCVALVDFTEITPSYGKYEAARYRWRSADLSGATSSGTGKVFAKYFKFGDISVLNNRRYEPWIKTGGLWTEWSYCGPTSSWVYYHPNRSQASVIPDKDFDTYELKITEKGN
jgi:hypothetical protein